ADADGVKVGDGISEIKWTRTVQSVLLPCGLPDESAGTCGLCAAAGGSRYLLFPWVLPPRE
ncbi:MAG: hypothetical protein WBM04_00595, partial [Candidatus Korobacteraceae bacterium]